MQVFGMKSIVAEFIPWLLLPERKEHLATVTNDLIHTATNEPDFLMEVITGDESWVYSYDLETMAQSVIWMEAPWLSAPKGSAAKSQQDQDHVLNSGRDAGRTVWDLKTPTMKGTEESLSYVQCFLYLLQYMSLLFILYGGIYSGQTL